MILNCNARAARMGMVTSQTVSEEGMEMVTTRWKRKWKMRS